MVTVRRPRGQRAHPSNWKEKVENQYREGEGLRGVLGSLEERKVVAAAPKLRTAANRRRSTRRNHIPGKERLEDFNIIVAREWAAGGPPSTAAPAGQGGITTQKGGKEEN